MAERTSNVEFAHRIHEQGHASGPHGHRTEWIEILEAVVLAAVAVLTAWSGYQAARWDARSAASYARASSTMVQAQEQLTLAGQDHLYDIATFNAWLNQTLDGNAKGAELLRRRFRPEYAAAFEAWIRLDPLSSADPKTPPGPSSMAEYRSARNEKGRELTREASRLHEEGVANKEKGDEYVRLTVVLATVLLLIALSQRFKIRGPRIGLLAVAYVMLSVAVYWIATFPRA
jgi:hypothetical protein